MNDRLKKIRQSAGLSQTAFGEAVGVSLSAVQKWESGQNVVSPQAQYVICDKFGISRRWLETGDGDMIDPSSANDIRLLTQAMEGQCEAKKTILRAVASMPDDLLTEVLKYLREAQKDPRA